MSNFSTVIFDTYEEGEAGSTLTPPFGAAAFASATRAEPFSIVSSNVFAAVSALSFAAPAATFACANSLIIATSSASI